MSGSVPEQPRDEPSAGRRWVNKFAHALRGLRQAPRTQSSFWVHYPAAGLVLAAAWWLAVPPQQTTILLLCIGIVLAAEYFNTALELLAKKLHPQHDPQIGRALDAAAAAVLVTALTAAVCGLRIFAVALWQWWAAA